MWTWGNNTQIRFTHSCFLITFDDEYISSSTQVVLLNCCYIDHTRSCCCYCYCLLLLTFVEITLLVHFSHKIPFYYSCTILFPLHIRFSLFFKIFLCNFAKFFHWKYLKLKFSKRNSENKIVKWFLRPYFELSWLEAGLWQKYNLKV